MSAWFSLNGMLVVRKSPDIEDTIKELRELLNEDGLEVKEQEATITLDFHESNDHGYGVVSNIASLLAGLQPYVIGAAALDATLDDDKFLIVVGETEAKAQVDLSETLLVNRVLPHINYLTDQAARRLIVKLLTRTRVQIGAVFEYDL